MRASARSRHAARRPRDDAGQVGIGTMIIFISTVLTAAVAAGVVIDSANNLQEKAQRTGLEATDQVANNIVVTTIQGAVNSGATSLDSLNITIALAPGSKQVDLSQMLIRLSNGTAARELKYLEAGTGNTFNVTILRDPDASFTGTTPVLTSSDLARVNVNLNATGVNMNLGTRKTVELTLQPEVGTKVATELKTPPTYVAGQVVLMR